MIKAENSPKILKKPPKFLEVPKNPENLPPSIAGRRGVSVFVGQGGIS